LGLFLQLVKLFLATGRAVHATAKTFLSDGRDFLQLVWLLGSGGAVLAAKWIFFAIRRAVLELLEPFLELVGLLYFRY
jgi:hypothetical protein